MSALEGAGVALARADRETSPTSVTVPAFYDWSSLSWEDADRLAWEAVCEWPGRAGVDPIHEDIDFGLVARGHLRAKVGSAIRRLRDSQTYEFEERLRHDERRAERRKLEKRLRPGVRRGLRLLGQTVRRSSPTGRGRTRPDLFVPVVHKRWEHTIRAIEASCVASVLCREPVARRARVHGHAHSIDFGATLAEGVRCGLAPFGIHLPESDIEQVARDLAWSHATLELAIEELSATRPRLLVTYSDNDSPGIEFTLAARRLGILSLMVQHGLDCEHLVLDDSYADYLALWGDARRRRYHELSARRAQLTEVIGNPEFDRFRLPERMNLDGQYWLWLTRPHTPRKCYLPSRCPREGEEILKALLSAVHAAPGARLVIKPHPSDYADVYRVMVERADLGDRVSITNRPVQELVTKAALVFTEDTTASAEAMFLGKPLVHVHFASSPPSIPLVESEAALAAVDHDAVLEAVKRVHAFDAEQRRRMIDGQRAFLRDQIGPCDGRAGARLERWIRSRLGEL